MRPLDAPGNVSTSTTRPVSWEVGDEWYRTARPAMDGLRVAEKTVELLCESPLRAPTAGCARALNQAVWHQEHDDMPISGRLEPFKSAFLDAARRSLGTGAQDVGTYAGA